MPNYNYILHCHMICCNKKISVHNTPNTFIQGDTQIGDIILAFGVATENRNQKFKMLHKQLK
jgi:hypothetical protein